MTGERPKVIRRSMRLPAVLRGPRGGYQLARERRRITVGEIVRTAMSLSTADPEDLGSKSICSSA